MSISSKRQEPAIVSGASDTPSVLYILSPSYSGSTLLTFMMAAHPGIATVGELKASAMGDITQYRCSCGQLLRECQFWKQVQSAMIDRGIAFSLEDFGTHFASGPRSFRRAVKAGARNSILRSAGDMALATIPSWRLRLRSLRTVNRALVEIITPLQGGNVFLDGSKDPERLRQLRLEFGADVRVIHLVRDGRGMTNSYMKHYGVGMERAVKEWMATDRECKKVLKGFDPSNIRVLRYEDLCGDPDGKLGELFRFAGLSPNPSQLRKDVSDFHILGNAMRLDTSRRIAIDEKWRRELDPDALAVFYKFGGKLNENHGFSDT
jgi:hypothetical protein